MWEIQLFDLYIHCKPSATAVFDIIIFLQYFCFVKFLWNKCFILCILNLLYWYLFVVIYVGNTILWSIFVGSPVRSSFLILQYFCFVKILRNKRFILCNLHLLYWYLFAVICLGNTILWPIFVVSPVRPSFLILQYFYNIFVLWIFCAINVSFSVSKIYLNYIFLLYFVLENDCLAYIRCKPIAITVFDIVATKTIP